MKQQTPNPQPDSNSSKKLPITSAGTAQETLIPEDALITPLRVMATSALSSAIIIAGGTSVAVPPFVTSALLAINLAVFGTALALASQTRLDDSALSALCTVGNMIVVTTAHIQLAIVSVVEFGAGSKSVQPPQL